MSCWQDNSQLWITEEFFKMLSVKYRNGILLVRLNALVCKTKRFNSVISPFDYMYITDLLNYLYISNTGKYDISFLLFGLINIC